MTRKRDARPREAKGAGGRQSRRARGSPPPAPCGHAGCGRLASGPPAPEPGERVCRCGQPSLWPSVTTRPESVTAPQKADTASAKAEPHLLTTAGAPWWQHTCLAFLKPLEEAQLLTQDLPEQPGNEEHGPGPAGPARVHQRVGHQGDAALGPEAAGGGACGGQRQQPVAGGRPPPVGSPGLLPRMDCCARPQPWHLQEYGSHRAQHADPGSTPPRLGGPFNRGA